MGSGEGSNVIRLCEVRAERAARLEQAAQARGPSALPIVADELICYFGVHKLVEIIYDFYKTAPAVAQRVLSDFNLGELRSVERFIASVDPTLAAAFVSTVLAIQDLTRPKRGPSSSVPARRTTRRRRPARLGHSPEDSCLAD